MEPPLTFIKLDSIDGLEVGVLRRAGMYRSIITVMISLLSINVFADICDRSEIAQRVILQALNNSLKCEDVKSHHLEGIQTLYMSDINASDSSEFKASDLEGLVNVTEIQRIDFEMDEDTLLPLVNLEKIVAGPLIVNSHYPAIVKAVKSLTKLKSLQFSLGRKSCESGLILESNTLKTLDVAFYCKPGEGDKLFSKFFSKLSSLETLFLAPPTSSSVGSEIFKPLSDLTTFGLVVDTQLLEANAFENLNKLQNMYLDAYVNGNGNAQLPTPLFAGLSNVAFMQLNLTNSFIDFSEFSELKSISCLSSPYSRYLNAWEQDQLEQMFGDDLYHDIWSRFTCVYDHSPIDDDEWSFWDR